VDKRLRLGNSCSPGQFATRSLEISTRGITLEIRLSIRQATLNSVLQSKTTQRPERDSKAAQATTLAVPFMGREVFFGSDGGSHDHIVAEIGSNGDNVPELIFWRGEPMRGDIPQDTRPSMVSYDNGPFRDESLEIAQV
jgi:hypothetical protein